MKYLICFLLLGVSLTAWEQPRLAARTTSSQAGVIEVQSLDQLQKEIQSGGRVFVDFYSTTCPPCKRLAPKYAEYAKDLSSKGKFLKVNVYAVNGSLNAYNIRAFPTVIVFENGKETKRLMGLPEIPNYFEAMK